jgi:general L-amino acid transport system permease protein
MRVKHTVLSGLFVITLGVALTLIAWSVHNNLKSAGLELDFGVFWDSAGFDVSERLIPYDAGDSYARVIITGFLNTLLLALTSIITASILGVWVGFLSVSSRWSIRTLAWGFVELLRNQPKILVLLILFVVMVQTLPSVSSAWSIGGVVLSNRALLIPAIPLGDGILILGYVAAVLVWLRRRPHLTPSLLWSSLVIIAVAGWLLLRIEVPIDRPIREGFDYRGGLRISTQFLIMLLCLTLYHGAQIAEVVRGGIQAIPMGQIDAARALGLPPNRVRWLIIWPQTLRLIFPPLSNQYINTFKNTSIAIAVGYSDLMSVTGTMINQTFRPIEAMSVTIGLYMVSCLIIATGLNRLNHRLNRHSRA